MLLVWNSGVPAELETMPYEAAQNGARLYRVTGQLAQAILDGYINGSLFAQDDVFSRICRKRKRHMMLVLR